MFRLLLDEHISPDVAEGLHRGPKKIPVLCLLEWDSGRFLGTSDDLLLEAAAVQNLTFVTYDRRTIPPLLKLWAEMGRDHGGIVFIDEKTIRPSDIGGPICALQRLFRETRGWDWKNRVVFLRR